MADLSMYLDDIDYSAIRPSTGVPEAVPPGDYLLQADSFELLPTKDGTGMILKAVLTVLSGEYEGRKIFPQFNVRNKSSQAQTIGLAEFKALCLACGVDETAGMRDTDTLLWKPFRAMVGFAKEQINPATGLPYPPKNEIKRYIPAGQAAPAAPAARPPAQAAPAPAARPAVPQPGRPWDRPKTTGA